jgi:hypothetical protein
MLVTLISFWHYAVIRQQPLTPSIAFTSIIGEQKSKLYCTDVVTDNFFVQLVFNELKFALSALPETFIEMLQVSYHIPGRGKDRY